MTIMDQIVEEVSNLEKSLRKAIEAETISKKASEIILTKCIEGLVLTQLQSAISASARARAQEAEAGANVPPPSNIITN